VFAPLYVNLDDIDARVAQLRHELAKRPRRKGGVLSRVVAAQTDQMQLAHPLALKFLAKALRPRLRVKRRIKRVDVTPLAWMGLPHHLLHVPLERRVEI